MTRVDALTPEDVPSGTRIRVTGIAMSEAEQLGYVDDTKVLMGQEGTVMGLTKGVPQLLVDWDNDEPGMLALAGGDEIEVIGAGQ